MTAVARLSDDAVLEAWEEAASAGPVERAVALAAAASPAAGPETVERWSIGRRDALLLDAHAASFGDSLPGLTECPECSETLELTLRASELRTGHGDADEVHDLDLDGVRIHFRLPTSRDLIEVGAAADPATARELLVDRCVVAAEAERRELGAASVDALAERIAACDPQSDVRLALTCPACGHSWSVPFDIADFLWRRVDDRARALLAEIASLASAFGWREEDILALGRARRAHYLRLVAR